MGNIVYFNASMSGASPLSQTLGSLIAILDDCLVNGFGQVTLDSVVVSGGVATATRSGGHSFAMIVSGVGPVIRLAGATPSGINGDFRITVTSPSQFTFPCPGVSDGTATGIITAKRAPAGWMKEFAGTHKAVYRGNTMTGSGWYFLVDASASTAQASYQGFKTMSDVSTGTRGSVTSLMSIANAKAGSSDWELIADDRTVWLRNTEVSAFAYSYLTGFGDFSPANPSDADCAMMGGMVFLALLPTTVNTQSVAPLSISSYRLNLCSGYSDLVSRGGNAYFPSFATNGTASVIMPGGQDYSTAWPNVLTGLTDVGNILALESGNPRGTLRGLWAPLHKYSNIPAATAIPLPNGKTGLRLLCEDYTAARSGAVIADLVGPW